MSFSKRSNLPPEIIEDILPRLPTKSLGRFKSVSKTWNSLISDPKFIKNHINKQCHQTPKVILISSGCNSLYSVDVNELQQHINEYKNNHGEFDIEMPETAKQLTLGSSTSSIHWHEVLGSCNGLVLVKDLEGKLFMVNPITKELRKVPSNRFGIRWNIEHYVMYGFGYVSSTDDYKVVSISFRERKRGMAVSVYSLRENAWRKLPNAPYRHSVDNVCAGVLFNESLHWFADRPKSSKAIVAFSLVDEEFNEIELPKVRIGLDELVVVGGKLGFFDPDGVYYALWVMEEYGIGKSWINVCLDEGSERKFAMGDDDRVVIYKVEERRRFNERSDWDPEPNAFDVGCMYSETLESPANCIRRAP